jgi:hypothetical protein
VGGPVSGVWVVCSECRAWEAPLDLVGDPYLA